jgi:phosphatidylethanolamine-binding protein (PEBP) family uncharacterized protein
VRLRSSKGVPALALGLLALAVAGCGSSSHHASASTTTTSSGASTPVPFGLHRPESSQRPNVATIGVENGARLPHGGIAPQYTCHGANISPPIFWGAVPSKAQELIVVVRTIAQGRVTTNWIVAGVNPARREVRPGRVPPEAVVGLNSFGEAKYNLCPPSGKPALVVMGVYASPHKLSLQQGFNQRALASVVGNPEVAWGSSSAFVNGGSNSGRILR